MIYGKYWVKAVICLKEGLPNSLGASLLGDFFKTNYIA